MSLSTLSVAAWLLMKSVLGYKAPNDPKNILLSLFVSASVKDFLWLFKSVMDDSLHIKAEQKYFEWHYQVNIIKNVCLYLISA